MGENFKFYFDTYNKARALGFTDTMNLCSRMMFYYRKELKEKS